MKKLIAVLLTLLVAGVAACASPEATATALSESSTTPAAATTAAAVPPEATPPVESTVPSGYDIYNNMGWLTRTWNLSPLWADPGVPSSGRLVHVGASIYIGDVPLSYIHAELSVNGVVVDSTQLVFWFDDPLPFSLSFTPDKPGVYEVFIRANMLENEGYVKSTGEDLSLYSAMTLTVSA